MRKGLIVLVVMLVAVWPVRAQAAHSVQLTCTASTTIGVTYNFLRAGQTGGPYAQINLSPVGSCSFLDGNVTNGQTYFYVANAFDSVTLSSFSNEAKAVIPSAPAPPTNLTALVK